MRVIDFRIIILNKLHLFPEGNERRQHGSPDFDDKNNPTNNKEKDPTNTIEYYCLSFSVKTKEFSESKFVFQQ